LIHKGKQGVPQSVKYAPPQQLRLRETSNNSVNISSEFKINDVYILSHGVLQIVSALCESCDRPIDRSPKVTHLKKKKIQMLYCRCIGGTQLVALSQV
jgi:hypothetical protein